MHKSIYANKMQRAGARQLQLLQCSVSLHTIDTVHGIQPRVPYAGHNSLTEMRTQMKRSEKTWLQELLLYPA
jgi:hypothetical protein